MINRQYDKSIIERISGPLIHLRTSALAKHSAMREKISLSWMKYINIQKPSPS